MKRSTTWDCFLRIPPDNTSYMAPFSDMWLASRDIHPGAPTLIRLLREEVIPLLNKVRRHLIDYVVLVHDDSSGAPSYLGDGPWVHLQLQFQKPVALVREKWVVRSRPNIDHRWKQIAKQSRWFMEFLSTIETKDEIEILKIIKQQLHYFANMAQMKVA